MITKEVKHHQLKFGDPIFDGTNLSKVKRIQKLTKNKYKVTFTNGFEVVMDQQTYLLKVLEL